MHHQGQVYLRARWYAPGQGWFVSEDPFAGFAELPYSLHAYQYAYSNPVRWTDPSGRCIAWGENSNFCDTITTWERFEDVFPYFDYRHNPYGDTPAEIGQYYGISPREAAEWAAGYWTFAENPGRYWSNPRHRDNDITALATAFSSYFLGIPILRLVDADPVLLAAERDYLVNLGECNWTWEERIRYVEIAGILGLYAGGNDGTGSGRLYGGGFHGNFLQNMRGVNGPRFHNGGGGGGRGRAPEFPGGQLSETLFPDTAMNYLGPGYREVSPGRYVSADGMRQVRYGAHETGGRFHHAHFEAYDRPYNAGGRVIENTVVELVP